MEQVREQLTQAIPITVYIQIRITFEGELMMFARALLDGDRLFLHRMQTLRSAMVRLFTGFHPLHVEQVGNQVLETERLLMNHP